jgi:GT2 family glycosyltransferase
MYALYKVLAAGWRVVYDPGTYVFHRHRRTPEALHRAFFGYGVGLSAAMAKIFAEEREPDAVRAWWWLVSQYCATQRDRALGRTDAREVRVAWDYLRGGVHGPRALSRATSIAREASAPGAQADLRARRSPARAAGAARAATQARSDASPALSVIVPTAGRPGPLARCLAALAKQDVETRFEIIVVDDDLRPQPEGPVAPPGLTFRVIHGGGRGAAAARNAGARSATGEVLLFLDDDLVPTPDLVRRHLAHHRGELNRIVIGRCPPRPPRRSLTDSAAALWWQDRYRDMAASAALTFTDVLSGNTSIGRTRFLSLGGFDEGLGTLRREDWYWGIQALKAGMAIAFDPDAVAAHEFVLTPTRRFAAAYAEGRGDAVLARGHPELIHALPSVDLAGRRVKHAILALALRHQRLRRVVIDVLDALERAHLRRTWFRLFQTAQAIEYARGRGVDTVRAPGSRHPALVVDPDSDEPLPRPEVCAPRLRLETDEKAIALTPEAGRWNANVAASLAAACESNVRRQRVPRGSRPAQPVTVLVGPGHRSRDRKRLLGLGDRGADVRCYEGPALAHWAALDRLIRAAATDVVATVIPGTLVEPRWLDEVSASLDGDRLALAIGGPADESEEYTHPWLVTRFEVLPRYPIIGRPFGYVALRRAHYLDLGGFDPSAMRFGHYAPSLELAERALDRGLVVVHRSLTQLRRGQASKNPVLRPEWQRQRARGALLARYQPASGANRVLGVTRGAAPLAGALVHRRSPSVKALGALGAYVLGAAEGVVSPRPSVELRRSQRLDPGLSLAGGRLAASASPWRAAMKELKKTISHAALNIRKAWMR